MLGARSYPWPNLVFLVLPLSASLVPTALAQESPVVEDLHAYYADPYGDWLGYTVEEVLAGLDLNGDGDTDDEVLHVRSLVTGKTMNLGDALYSFFAGHWLVLAVDEGSQGKDLNGDGDTQDWILHSYNLATGESTNLGLSAHIVIEPGDLLVLIVSERSQGKDLDGDGDMEDEVVHIHNLATGESTNLGLAADVVLEAGGRLVLRVSERSQGKNLDGDGDMEDVVVHIHNLATGDTTNVGLAAEETYFAEDRLVLRVPERSHGEDLNGDGDMEDEVAHVHDLTTGATTNLGLAWYHVAALRDSLVLEVLEASQGQDLDGDGGIDDRVLHVHDLATGATTNLRVVSYSFDLYEEWLLAFADEGLYIRNLVTGEHTSLALDVGGYHRSGDWLTLWATELARGRDLNGDGDTVDEVVHIHNLATGETINLGLAAGVIDLRGDTLLLRVYEGSQGQDVNGDGDTGDEIVQIYRLTTGEATNVEGNIVLIEGDTLVLSVPESFRGQDLNGDGDTADEVAHIHNLATGETINLGLAASVDALVGGLLGLLVREDSQGQDLNGDGDTDDEVVHTHDLPTGETTNLGFSGEFISLDFHTGRASSGDWLVLAVNEFSADRDLNGDGDDYDYVVHVHDLETGETTNLRVAAGKHQDRWGLFFIAGDWLVFGSYQATVHLVDLRRLGDLDPTFVRGDASADGNINISDSLSILGWLYLGADDPPCLDAADVDDDGTLQITDAVRLLNFLFLGGAPPPGPGSSCEVDASRDALDCMAFAPCSREG